MKTIEIQIPEGKSAEWVGGVLTLVDEKPKDVMDRIKTYEDACEELGIRPVSEELLAKLGFTKDEIAYRKLKTITKALNEGWKPDWTDNNESKFWPWFDVEIDPVIFSCAEPCFTHSLAGTGVCSQLYFKTRHLAIYAGTQFKDIYNDYLV